MELSRENIFEKINTFGKDVQEILEVDIPTTERIEEVLFEYFEIANFLVSRDDTEEDVIHFLTIGEDLIDNQIPEKYSPLKKLYDLYSHVKNMCESEIKQALDKKNYDKVLDTITFGLKCDIRNICFVNYIAENFKEVNLHNELITLYKLAFIYSLDPKYFEKIGDTQFEIEEYNDALESYLTCAESSDEYPEIYIKLSKVFEKLNDNDSRLACLEHAKTIEGQNG
jgi:tetratricopeptide (TPR) repeat protein